jgi:hypothetical protein
MILRTSGRGAWGASLVAWALSTGSAEARDLELVVAGRPRACLVIDSRRYPRREDVTNQWAILERTIGHVADTVVEYVRKSTGATLPIVDVARGAPPEEGVRLWIGRSEYVDGRLGGKLDGLDPSGYLIRACGERDVIIVGPTAEGTEFGTYEFLERFVGVRWLFPTEVGEHVPERLALTVPADTDVQDEPAFIQVPGVASKPSHQVWARRMRFWTRLNFHHSLVDLLPPDEYAPSHPEFFPLPRIGATERYLPRGGDYNWQPCFTAPGLADEAAKRIIAYLDRRPSVYSYSFGVNDSNLYCQCENCRREYVPGETFLGMACYSDAYFRFVNAVVERVLRAHPDAWFGCLAYSHVGRPPVNVDVHPRVIPFLTYDTLQLLDPGRRRAHEALVREWGAKCTFLGRYDYTYGDHHVPPRLYLHHWAEYVRWARQHQVRAWYAETYPFFGEGPKYYVMAKIWWDPSRDVDELLDEWHRLAFGAAAEPMRAYFDHWEGYWTQRVPKSDYFGRCRNEQYLLGNPGWLEGLQQADLERADAWIAEAERRANTPQTRARVAVMARAWQYYRTVIMTYLARGASGGRPSTEEALALLTTDGGRAVQQPLWSLYQELMADPILVFTWDASYPYGTAERRPLLDAVEVYLDTQDPRLAEALRGLSGGSGEAAALAATALAIGEGRAANLVPNPGFEAADPLEGWWSGMHQGTGRCQVTSQQAYEGGHAVEVTGTADGYGGVFRADVPVQPGRSYLFVLRARWEGEPAPATVCQMLTQFQDRNGRAIEGTLRSYRFTGASEWRAFSLETRAAPEGAAALLVRADALYQPATGHRVSFDALEVYDLGG